MTAATQPKLAEHDEIAQRLYEICDQIIDWGHASANIAVVPAKDDGSPDHGKAHPVNMASPSSDSGPFDMAEALRWVVLIDDIDACEPQTSLIFWVNHETGNPTLEQVSGPAADADIAMRIIARDIGAAPPVQDNEPSALLKSMDEFIARRDREKPIAANDNKPAPQQAPAAKTAGATVVQVINPADWHGEPVPTREWYCEGLIPMRTVTILNGDGGVGKSCSRCSSPRLVP